MSILTQVRDLLTGLTNMFPPPDGQRGISILLWDENPGGLQISFWDDRGEILVRLTPEDLEKDLEELLREVLELLGVEVSEDGE
jgi:hypothetical protein